MPKPYKDLASIKEAIELKEKGLGLTKIADEMGVHKKSVWRWLKYYEEKRDVRQAVATYAQTVDN